VDLSRAAAAALDDADPLAGFRARFTGTDDDGPGRLLYLDGNSLGRLPTETPAAAVARVVEQEWGRGLVGSWNSWVGQSRRIGDVLAHRPLCRRRRRRPARDDGARGRRARRRGPGARVLAAALDERVAVVVLSQVAYRSGALVDVAVVTAPT
jgi:kynureninase